jgi:hypothetical protein
MALREVHEQVRQLREAIFSGMTGGPIVPMGRKRNTEEKRPVEPGRPMEPIEDKDEMGRATKPSFEDLVDAARSALLSGKDPHVAVEAAMNHVDESEPTEVTRAVEAALKSLVVSEMPK